MAKRQRLRRQERRRRHVEARWTTKRSVITGAGLTAGAILGVVPAAHATDFTVTNLSDGASPGPDGSLRKAITDANANLGPDRVLFDSSLSGTVYLTNGSLPITQALEVKGPGPDTLGIDAYYSNTRIFYVNPTTSGDAVTISGLSMSYGHTTGSGGAIVNIDSKLTVADDFLFNNTATFSGIGAGAIEDSGAYMSGSATTIRNTTITGNSAPNGSGGGLGGALQVGNVINSTINSNYAYVYGGGVFANDNGADFQNSTVAGNYSYGSGGGIVNGTGGPHTSFLNSLVGDNDAQVSGADLLGSDPFDADFSLIEDTGGVTLNSSVSGSNITGTDPQLPYFLTSNDGTAPTLVPDYNSPVIDQGKTAGGVTTDERGFARPFDLVGFPNSAATGADGADMGAVEETVNETTPADLSLGIVDSPDPATVGSPLNYAFTVTNDGPNPATGVTMDVLVPSDLSLNVSSLSGNCNVTGTVPDYATYFSCDFGSVGDGASKTENATVTPLDSAASLGYVTSYASVSGDQADPDRYSNFTYADTVVQRPSTPTPPPPVQPGPGNSGAVAAAIKRCKKKFHGKKRKKCIKRAKGHASASVLRKWRRPTPVHPFTKHARPRGIEPLAGSSRLERLQQHGD
jgi:uncharacterized repeat protein (TIGR01451 family)